MNNDDKSSKGGKESFILSKKDFGSLKGSKFLIKYCELENISSAKRELKGLMKLGSQPSGLSHHLINKIFLGINFKQYNHHLKNKLEEISGSLKSDSSN
jgi:hypothetical protein